MSPDHESSYYEIALTNKQVLTIFVVLLTCLVAAFLSGVWIGRSGGAEGPLLAEAAETPGESETAQLTELNFFSEGQRDGTGAGVDAKPPQRRQPSSQEEPAPRPASQPPPAKREPPPAEPPPSPPAAPATVAGRVIQVFSTADAAQADKLVRRLGDGGYPAFLVEENLQGRTTYRVRVGPYQREAQARQVAEELRRQYRLDTWITTQPG